MPQIEPFSPELFVGRADVLNELLEWATASSVTRRLRSIAAPPGYGKSWLLIELSRYLKEQSDLFIVTVPTLELTSKPKIEEWLPTVIRDGQRFCDAVSSIDQSDSPGSIIFHLVEKLSIECNLRPILVVDALDELTEDQQRILEKQLLEVFWLLHDVRIIVSFRDENRLFRPSLRRGEKRIKLQTFSTDEGQEQLHKRSTIKQEKLELAADDLLKLLSPYTLTIPGLNTLLIKQIQENEAVNSSPLLAADHLNKCWRKLIGENLGEQPQFTKELEKDLWKVARFPENSWDLETFAELCDYTEYQAQQRIDGLMALGVAMHSGQQRYQLIDGLTEILRLELRLRFGLEIYSKFPEEQSAGLGKSSRKVQIFLSYAREDKEAIESLYQKLSDSGHKPWMDTKDILPGEKWPNSIRKAINESDFFLACLSCHSVNKRGFLQREINQALNNLPELLEDDIFLIPVRLEDCDLPDSLSDFQWVDLYEPDGWTRLLKAIEVGVLRRPRT